MKKIYIIVPLVLLFLFSFVYRDHTAKQVVIKAERAAAEAAAAAEEEARKLAAEKSSREESARRTAQREAEAAAKEAARRQQWEDAGAQIAAETAKYRAEGDAHSKRVNELEIEIVELRRQKDQKTNQLLALAEEVELANVSKRNAELEIQRLVDMVAIRLAQSSLTRPPPPPPAPTPSR